MINSEVLRAKQISFKPNKIIINGKGNREIILESIIAFTCSKISESLNWKKTRKVIQYFIVQNMHRQKYKCKTKCKK